MSSPMKIIASKTRASVLGVFFGNPGREYYLRQLEEMTGYSAGNIRREMVRLESDGLFSHHRHRKRKAKRYKGIVF